MPIIVSTPPPQAQPASFVLTRRINPVSSVDMFAATRMYHRGRRGILRRRRVPNMTDLTANLVVYTPMMKSDGGLTILSKAVDPDEMPDWQRRLMQTGAISGLVAAPVATVAALRSARRNEGGMPRDIARAVAPRIRNQKVRTKALRAIAALDTPVSRKAKMAALAAGAGAVGLQGVATGSDLLVTRMMASKDKEKH